MNAGHRADPSHFDVRASRVDAGSYDWRSGAQRIDLALRAPYEYLERALRMKVAGALVLDYGCGHGVHSVPPAKRGARVIGVDLSPRALAVARERAERASVADRVRFVAGDGTMLPFADESFDHALAVDVLPYVDPHVAFAELARVLRPTGSLIVIDTLGHNPLFNLNRRLRARRGDRTRGEVQHVPRIADVAVGMGYFGTSDMRFFDLLTPFAAPFHRQGGRAGAFTRWLAGTDRLLLRFAPLQRLALKVVCTFSRPVRARGSTG